MSETPSPEKTQRYTVPPRAAGERLDRFLAAVAGLSRSRVQAAVKAGDVRVEGEVVQRTGHPVQAGHTVELAPAASRAGAESLDWEARVLLEDPYLVVLAKPAGVLCHAQGEVVAGTLAGRAEERWGPLPRLQGEDRPGIVHRLDRGTSGLMVLARTAEAMEALQAQFRERAVEKRYLALVHGVPRFQSGWVEDPIGRSPKHPDRFAVLPAGEGREASTYWELRERFDGFALLECRPKTGRTHQLRVHLTHAGHGIVGDRVYRTRGVPARLPPEAPAPQRQALHAAGLAFRHPVTGEALAFEEPLPADLEALLAWLREHRPPPPLGAG